MIHGELQQAEAAALVCQPLIQQQLEVTAALEPGEGIRIVAFVQLGCGRIEVAYHPQQLTLLVAAHPLFQPDVVALMVQDAILEAQPVALATLARPDGLFQAGGIVRVHPCQPAEIIQLIAFKPQQLQAGGIAPQPLLRRPDPDPGLQHLHGLRHQGHIEPGHGLNPGSYISFHHTPRNRIQISAQISSIGARAEQQAQPAFPPVVP
ncbi:hypothetical protein D3C84_791060 [compost metagenome]